MPEPTFDNPREFRHPGKKRRMVIFSRHGHRWLMTRAKWTWMQHHGNIKGNHAIHHIDGDPTNDDIGNLKCVPMKRHIANHRELNRKGSYHAKT